MGRLESYIITFIAMDGVVLTDKMIMMVISGNMCNLVLLYKILSLKSLTYLYLEEHN